MLPSDGVVPLVGERGARVRRTPLPLERAGHPTAAREDVLRKSLALAVVTTARMHEPHSATSGRRAAVVARTGGHHHYAFNSCRTQPSLRVIHRSPLHFKNWFFRLENGFNVARGHRTSLQWTWAHFSWCLITTSLSP